MGVDKFYTTSVDALVNIVAVPHFEATVTQVAHFIGADNTCYDKNKNKIKHVDSAYVLMCLIKCGRYH